MWARLSSSLISQGNPTTCRWAYCLPWVAFGYVARFRWLMDREMRKPRAVPSSFVKISDGWKSVMGFFPPLPGKKVDGHCLSVTACLGTDPAWAASSPSPGPEHAKEQAMAFVWPPLVLSISQKPGRCPFICASLIHPSCAQTPKKLRGTCSHPSLQMPG